MKTYFSKLIFTFNRILDEGLAFNDFQKCIICGKSAGFFPICKVCSASFTVDTQTPRCKNCGKFLISENDVCFDCREETIIRNLDSVFPIFSYRLWNKEILFKWKIEGQRNLAFLMAREAVNVYKKYFDGIPIAVVPPRPRKIFKTGWDQINDLSKIMRFCYGIKCISPLVRCESKQQKKLNREQRIERIGKVYALNKKNSGSKPPEEVVLLDDILTTGVTLESCAEVLKEWGVKKVYGVTLFTAD